MSIVHRVVLIGPSGSGKSSIGRQLAGRLGFELVDTDAVIAERIEMSIAQFFSRFGESAFRAIESEAVAEACRREQVVIATGGGAVLAERNWHAMRPGSAIIALSAAATTLVSRVQAQADEAGDDIERPLLAGDAVGRMRGMLAARSQLYNRADRVIDTQDRSPAEVLEMVDLAVKEVVQLGEVPNVSLLTPFERSDIYVGPGSLDMLRRLPQRWPRAKTAWIVTDEHVGGIWLEPVADWLRNAGIEATPLVVEPGEGSKGLDQVTTLTTAMTNGRATRSDVVVALGGGVVGDLAGFVASICLRGLPVVQVPTSLLAMVDSSVGGKTGVNMPAGKNLVGSFYQPGVVLVDPRFLDTLPRPEYRSGMAEVIKHALIQPSTPLGGEDLLQLLREHPLDPLPTEITTAVLRRNVAIKHSVVEADERESGLRMLLNYGHTIGHAIEADGYRYRHGEAIGLGLLAVARLARDLGRVEDDYVALVSDLVGRAGLPTRFDGSTSEVLDRMTRDKKNVAGSLHWILARREGGVEVVTDVPLEAAAAAIRSIGGS